MNVNINVDFCNFLCRACFLEFVESNLSCLTTSSDNTAVLRRNVRSVHTLCVCVYWLSFLTLMAPPLQDSYSLERRKPISLNSQGAAQRDTKVLHNNSQLSNLITVRGQRVQDGGSQRAKKWAQTQDASISIESSPAYCSLLSYPLRSKPLLASEPTHIQTHFSMETCTHWKVYLN